MMPGTYGTEFATPPSTSAVARPPGDRKIEEMYP